MTLREWCQREGHPYVTQVMVVEPGGGFHARLEAVGKACACGQRHEPMPHAERAYRVLIPRAVDAEGRDRTEPT